MTHLKLCLFGGFDLRSSAATPLVIPAKKAKAMLAYLALRPGQAQARSKLAALLWEDCGEVQARSSLRQALAGIRKALRPHDAAIPLADAENVTLRAEAIWVDVLEFERYLRDGSPTSLEQAVALYSGELLEGFDPKAPAFEDWLMSERERLRERAIAALDGLLAHQAACGTVEAGIQAAMRLLSLDPLRESVHRTLMRLYLRQGRPGLALRQYRTCRTLLRRELGAMPEAETNRLYGAIMERRDTSLTATGRIDDAGPVDEVRAAETLSDMSPNDSREIKAPSLPPAAELRQATILVANLSEPRSFVQEHDPEIIHTFLRRYFELVEEPVRRHGGIVVRLLTDRVMALFGAPVAHSNDAERAVRAALHLHPAVAALTCEGRSDLMRVQIGIASGQVMVSYGNNADLRECTATGAAVTLAADLAARAAAGETLIAESVYRSVSARIDCEPADRVVGAASKPPWLVRAVRAEAAVPPGHRFVGRQSQRWQFESALTACAHTHAGQAILVRGEPGIGKTRLLRETTALAESRGFQTHKALALDFGASHSQDPVRMLVRSLLGCPEACEFDAVCAAAEQAFESGWLAPDLRVFLNDLLDLPQPASLRTIYDAMDGTARQRGKQAVVAALIKAISKRQPALLTVDDIHWADAQTLADLAGITAALRDCPAILVMTSRIEGDPLDAAWRSATTGASFSTIDLGPLRSEEAVALAAQYVDIDQDFAQRCIQRAEGNPLFLEQLLLSGREGGDEIPDSVQSIVWARLDKLDPHDKEALQAASILGQRFELSALRHLIEAPDYSCARLVEHVLVRPEGEDYLFAHALVLEAVYRSLLGSRRRALHRRAANWFAGRDAVVYAEHLDRAQDPAAATAYLEAARAQAAEYRYERALQLVDRALALPSEDSTRFELTSLRGELLRDLATMQESIAAFRTALEIAKDDVEKARAWIGIARSVEVMDRHYEALEALRHAESAIRGQRLPDIRAQIHHLRGNTYFTLSDIEGCLKQHEEALICAREAASAKCEAQALSGLADAFYQRGRMRTAYEHFDRCVELCRHHGFGRIEVANLAMRGLTRSYQNDFQAALEDCLTAVEMAVKVGDLRAEMLARDNAAVLLLETADWRGVRDQEEQSLALARRLSARCFEASTLGTFGLATAALGQRAEAEKLLRQAYSISRESGPAFSGPWVLGGLALVATAETRQWALCEGEKLLRDGCVSHNYFYFYRDAIQVCLEDAQWSEVERYAHALEDYTRPEPLSWSDFLIARARELAAHGRGARDEATYLELERLRNQAEHAGLKALLPAIEKALGA